MKVLECQIDRLCSGEEETNVRLWRREVLNGKLLRRVSLSGEVSDEERIARVAQMSERDDPPSVGFSGDLAAVLSLGWMGGNDGVRSVPCGLVVGVEGSSSFSDLSKFFRGDFRSVL